MDSTSTGGNGSLSAYNSDKQWQAVVRYKVAEMRVCRRVEADLQHNGNTKTQNASPAADGGVTPFPKAVRSGGFQPLVKF